MTRVPLSAEASRRVWQKFYDYQAPPGEPTMNSLADCRPYYNNMGWDIAWEPPGWGWTIPEHQLAFFLLTL